MPHRTTGDLEAVTDDGVVAGYKKVRFPDGSPGTFTWAEYIAQNPLVVVDNILEFDDIE